MRQCHVGATDDGVLYLWSLGGANAAGMRSWEGNREGGDGLD